MMLVEVWSKGEAEPESRGGRLRNGHPVLVDPTTKPGKCSPSRRSDPARRPKMLAAMRLKMLAAKLPQMSAERLQMIT
jgi:hypothetical protein